MNSSEIFKAAHKMTKSALQAGDSYAVTFAAALVEVYKALKFKLENAMSIVMAGGSEKQNDWATQIVEAWVKKMTTEAEYNIDRASRDTVCPEKFQKYGETLKEKASAFGQLMVGKGSKFVIKNRSADPTFKIANACAKIAGF
mgnify:FL=1